MAKEYTRRLMAYEPVTRTSHGSQLQSQSFVMQMLKV